MCFEHCALKKNRAGFLTNFRTVFFCAYTFALIIPKNSREYAQIWRNMVK